MDIATPANMNGKTLLTIFGMCILVYLVCVYYANTNIQYRFGDSVSRPVHRPYVTKSLKKNYFTCNSIRNCLSTNINNKQLCWSCLSLDSTFKRIIEGESFWS